MPEPSNLYPDYMGEDCLNADREFDIARHVNIKTAFVSCVNYILALNFWKLKAVQIFQKEDGYSFSAALALSADTDFRERSKRSA